MAYNYNYDNYMHFPGEGPFPRAGNSKSNYYRLCQFCFKMRYILIILLLYVIAMCLYSNASKANFYLMRPVPHENLPVTSETIIYVITPTYARPVQKAELTRLSHVLRLAKDIHWVIVEDADEPSLLVTNLLKRSKLQHTHLVQPTPASWKLKNNEGRWSKPRGVLQRNSALTWVRENLPDQEKGVVYFADDDNTYTTELFDEIRSVKTVGVWPVGLVGGLNVEKPLVENGKVVGFNAGWRPERKFPVDMAGFAVSLKLLHSKADVAFSYESEGGFQETDFLSQLTTRQELEPKAANCTQILVWHTRTEKPSLVYEEKLKRQGKKPSDYGMEV